MSQRVRVFCNFLHCTAVTPNCYHRNTCEDQSTSDDCSGVPAFTKTASVNTGMVVESSVALITVVKDRPLTNRSWLITTPSKLQRVSHASTRFGNCHSSRSFRCNNVKTSAAPQMRKPTRLTLDIDLSAILPKMGQVPNKI